MAERNDKKLKFASVEELRQAYDFQNLQSFLDLYYDGAGVLMTEQDFYDVAYAYYSKAHRDTVKHVEIFFDPQTHTDRGISFKDVITGLTRARIDAEQHFGISSYYIMCFLKHLSEQDAMTTLKESLPYKDQIIGVGLDSTELGNPPEKFKSVMKLASEAGYELVSHAGEEGPTRFVEQALDVLNVKRIDHGIRSLDDPLLLQRLAKEQIPLTLCPMSNCKLCVIEKMEDFPLKAFLDANICCTINSDDPSYFGGYVNDNYKSVYNSLETITLRDLQTLAKNSFRASFAPESKKQEWMKEVDTYCTNYYNNNNQTKP